MNNIDHSLNKVKCFSLHLKDFTYDERFKFSSGDDKKTLFPVAIKREKLFYIDNDYFFNKHVPFLLLAHGIQVFQFLSKCLYFSCNFTPCKKK